MTATTAATYRGLSLWHDTVADDLTPRAPLPGDIDADVVIIGGGLTGLWSAWYLLQSDPALRIVVLEREVAGFGASGRNGGWCSALFPRSTASLERTHGLEAALAMRRAMIATVDEVDAASTAAGIDCDFVRGGTVAYARSTTQLAAARAEVAEASRYGVDPFELWSAERVSASNALGASFDPNCARLHPAKLVRGLARALEARGVRIYEQTRVLNWSKGSVTTEHGTVACDTIVVALEGYAATLPRLTAACCPSTRS